MFWLAKWGVDTAFDFSMIKRGVVDLAGTADWTPATGDVKRSLNGGTMGNTTNLPVAIAGAGSVGWRLTLQGSTELQTPVVYVQIVDAATKAVEDNSFVVYTYGNASAKIPADLSDLVRLGLTSLPNANAEAAGGLFTRGTGAGQINQPTNGMIDSNVVRWINVVVNALISGRVDASIGAVVANAIAGAALAADTGLKPIRANTARSGGTSTTILLDTGASAVDDFYNFCWIVITGGLGIGQVRRLRDYVGSTQIATVTRPWVAAQTPDNTSTYAILPATSAWDEFAADHVTAGTFGNVSGQQLTTSELLDNLVGPLATVVAGANTSSAFLITVPSVSEIAADWWKNAFVSFDLTSSLAGQYQKVSAYNQSTGLITVTSPFTATPATGDTARLVVR